MTWALACTGAFALLGWGAAFVFHGLLAMNRRRLARVKASTAYDVGFATEELAKAFHDLNTTRDELLRTQGKLRAYELADSARRRARAN